MTFHQKPESSPLKKQSIENFHLHVSSGKVAFFKKYNMDFVMGRREGPYLWDIDGEKRLFNLHCNGGVYNLGHRHPELIKVLRDHLDELDIGNSHLISRERGAVAKRISDLMPGDLDYTIFGVSGGEAVDVALKLARAYTGKTKIISAKGGYHGHTGLAMAAGDEKYRLPFGPQPQGFVQIPFGDIDQLAAEIGKDTAGVILETVPATLGMAIPPADYLPAVRDLCSRLNTVMILDEVQTGLGRTGKLWGFQHFDVVPDIVVLGKGLSGGIYPISATVIRKPLESVFHDDPFIHVSTFGGAEIGCRVAMRVLDISSSPEFLKHVNQLADRFAEGVKKLKDRHKGFLVALRQLGLMMGLEFKDALCGPIMTKAAYDNGILMVYANNNPAVCQFLPPLNMDIKEVDEIITRLDKAMSMARRLKPVVKIKQGVDRLVGKIMHSK
jgi:acetylornithine/succinyldiaminopimelate/putrescine aminotransferase